MANIDFITLTNDKTGKTVHINTNRILTITTHHKDEKAIIMVGNVRVIVEESMEYVVDILKEIEE